jgi:hypothetical protein
MNGRLRLRWGGGAPMAGGAADLGAQRVDPFADGAVLLWWVAPRHHRDCPACAILFAVRAGRWARLAVRFTADRRGLADLTLRPNINA